MTETPKDTAAPPRSPSRLRWLAGGIVVGILLTGVAVWQLMPRLMILEHPSRFGVEETISRLKQAAEAEGWSVPGVRDMNKSMAKYGVTFDRPVRLVELCKAEYAESVLSTDRHIATLMPCAVAVYEGDDGRTYVSHMNVGLMGTLFGGNIARVMGGAVARDEDKILSAVVAK
jgi:uncharacterized protein (DUF302 family)